jgi:hypothetical protein
MLKTTTAVMVAASRAAAVTADHPHERKSLGQDRSRTYTLLRATGLALSALRPHIWLVTTDRLN